MAKNIVDERNELLKLGRTTLQIPAQEDTLKKLTEGASISVKVLAAENTGGLSCALDTEYRRNVNIYYRAGGVCTITLEVSKDAKDWKPCYSKNLLGAENDIWITTISYRYIRVSSVKTGIDLEFQITAK